MKKTISFALFALLFTLAACSPKMEKGQFLFTVFDLTMGPNLYIGTEVVIDSTVHQFDYGDIVLFKRYIPGFEFLDLFRVVGLPTDSIAIDNNICVINGVKNAYEFMQKNGCDNEYIEMFPNGTPVLIYITRCFGDSILEFAPNVYVPDKHYFLMTDSRPSMDDEKFVPVPPVGIIGKLVKVLDP